MVNSYGYDLDFSWDHPWPRAPVPKDEELRLSELERYQILDTPQEERFNKLCRIACKEMKCPIAAVSFIDRTKQWFKANSGLTQAAIPRDVALCAHTIMNPRSAVVVLDTTQDERFKNNPLVTRASSVKFYAAVPLVTSRNVCIGSVFVFDVKTHSACETKLLQKIAAKVMKYLDERLQSPDGVPLAPAPATTHRSSLPSAQPAAEPSPSAKPERRMSADVTPAKSVSAPTSTVAPAPVKPAPASSPVAAAPPATESALVAAAPGAATDERSLATSAVSNNGEMTNMGAMLMNLLARTTETQQQLAAQQGVMFETLGHHSDQLNSLTETLSSLEMRIDRTVKAKSASK
ncbi:hypothetical protein SPRG_18818 [Saprolegnia parasitica CBS 223.65]|uniref:GAF domain-containing protein n=1 Tax=Saprolegnia parasitica (strain CBS 223.65) TaxID=695850 RepID=A0A067DAL4_SAPPC|nr:hypothetical protein SPRG_18818 [Saprolegnia parasitica CBS 223.65]KDO35656.1 hypothetical protein SPRG_18818 [Saprolegnia parasitica CBS 223.65]|eukprot:XP_012194035.1 hypothetical protein SPRG_18818 [Saprolegnia parasitica CBS 223.65]